MASSQVALFNSVPAGAIETLYDKELQPRFKCADLRRFLGIPNVKQYNLPHYIIASRSDRGCSARLYLGR